MHGVLCIGLVVVLFLASPIADSSQCCGCANRGRGVDVSLLGGGVANGRIVSIGRSYAPSGVLTLL